MSRFVRLSAAVALAWFCCAVAHAQAPSPASTVTSALSIVPQPVRVTAGRGRFTLAPQTTIWTDASSRRVGEQLAAYLEPATGWTLSVRTTGGPTRTGIVFTRD